MKTESFYYSYQCSKWTRHIASSEPWKWTWVWLSISEVQLHHRPCRIPQVCIAFDYKYYHVIGS